MPMTEEDIRALALGKSMREVALPDEASGSSPGVFRCQNAQRSP
jgi:hypothetical protein